MAVFGEICGIGNVCDLLSVIVAVPSGVGCLYNTTPYHVFSKRLLRQIIIQ